MGNEARKQAKKIVKEMTAGRSPQRDIAEDAFVYEAVATGVEDHGTKLRFRMQGDTVNNVHVRDEDFGDLGVFELEELYQALKMLRREQGRAAERNAERAFREAL